MPGEQKATNPFQAKDKSSILWVYKFDGNVGGAVKFIRDCGNPRHARIGYNFGVNCFHFPMVISWGDVPDDTIRPGDFLVVRPDGLTYAYTRQEVSSSLKMWGSDLILKKVN